MKNVDKSHHSSSKFIDNDVWLYKKVALNYLPAVTVTNKIKTIKNNFFLISDFTTEKLITNDLNEIKNMYNNSNDARKYSSSIGLIIDYLTRFYWTNNIEYSFDITIRGFKDIVEKYKLKNKNYVKEKLESIKKSFERNKEFNQHSIQASYQIVRFDAAYRAGYFNENWVNKNKINDLDLMPSYLVINTLNALKRLIDFIGTLKQVKFYLTFQNDKDKNLDLDFGYSFFIKSGDGDFCDGDTLYDIKCSKNIPTENDTLQLIIYFILAKHSEQQIYDNLKFIALVNPILNTIWKYDVSKFNNQLYKELEKNLLGFDFDPEMDKMWIDDIKANETLINKIKDACNQLEIETYSKK